MLEPPLDAAWEALSLRYSVSPKHLVPPGPSLAQWESAVGLALRAPDHRALAPFRFVVVTDEHRPALGELFAEGARRRGLDAAERLAARQRAQNGPGLAALVVRTQGGLAEVPPHEQWISAGAALMNLLNGLHLMGFGAKTLSGSSVSDAAVSAAFCAEGEQLVAWVVAGTPVRAAHPKAGIEAPAVPRISCWKP